MSTTTWVILQIWLTGTVGGLLWLLVAWTGKKWERLMLRRRNHPLARPMPARPAGIRLQRRDGLDVS